MPSDSPAREIRALMKRAVFLDIAAYLISVMFLGVTLSFALGLLLGTAVLLISLLLLRISVLRMEEDARRYGTSSQRRHLLFYAARLGVFALGFGAALLLRGRISPVAAVIPMLYPRIVYTAGALFSRSGSASGKKKR